LPEAVLRLSPDAVLRVRLVADLRAVVLRDFLAPADDFLDGDLRPLPDEDERELLVLRADRAPVLRLPAELPEPLLRLPAAVFFRAVAAPPLRPPSRAGSLLVARPRPEPLFFPPPSILFTVAQARRSASFRGTPRFS